MRHALPILLALLVGMLLPMGADADVRVWRVQRGEVLGTIAERFGVSVEQLREWNEIEGDRILAGQQLRVSEQDAPPTHPTYRVRAGETLSHIARRAGTSVETLRELNPGLEGDRVRIGEELRLPSPGPRLEHLVRRGESLGAIAERFRVSVRELRLWNPGLRPGGLQAGTRLVLFSEVPVSHSESVGRPFRGRLLRAERLGPHPGYALRNRSASWGTLETVMWIGEAFDAVLEAHPRSPRVRVHDLSLRRGGRMRGHRSHQSGRDVDISYYQHRCPEQECAFRRITAEELDAERQWALLHAWLSRDRLEAVFIDYSLQAPLYEEARRRGASRRQLHRWFQYPRGETYPLGIVRHFRKHRDHLHARFACPDTDEECR